MSYVTQTVSEYANRYANLKDRILLSLGYPVVRVELTDQHIQLAILDAITRYYDRAGHDLKMVVVSVSDHVNNYVTIPDDISPTKIEQVVFEQEIMDSFARGMFVTGTEDALARYIIPTPTWNNLLENFDMIGYYMFLQRLEDFKKLVGIDRFWEIQDGKIYLFPADFSYNQVGIVYKNVYSDTEYENTIWIQDWAVAKAKHMLGTIRGKMSGFQTAGGNISADGEALKTEAKEEMLALEEKLNQLQRPLPIMQF